MKRIIIFLGAIILGVALSFFFTKKQPPLVQTEIKQAGWKDVLPGVSETKDLLKLGTPSSVRSTDQETVYSYETTNQYWNNDVHIQNNQVAFVKERVFPLDEKSYATFLSGQTEAPIVLYGPDSASSLFLYVFPSRGTAALADKGRGFVYELWYFAPDSIENLLITPFFSEYSPTRKVQADI